MLLTVTPNPAIDRVFFLAGFRLGAILRAEREVVSPSGKGVDVSIFAHMWHEPTVATGLNAGYSGRLLAALLDERGVSHDFVVAGGETRTAVLLVDTVARAQSTVTAPSLLAGPEHLDQLLACLDRYASDAWGVVCAGSLPAGLPGDSYACLLRRARQHGMISLLDTSGQALRAGVAGCPDILKVNEDELTALAPDLAPVGATPAEESSLAAALAPRLGEWAEQAIVVTLGREGTLAVTGAGCYRARPPAVPVLSTAGAGDAVSTGLMLGRQRGEDWLGALRLATAMATSVVMHEGTSMYDPAQVNDLLSHVDVFRLSD